ncbi:MAG: hypothetical protein NT015_07465 [Alphaproteobacteria bacterium]|nr:hypothetical protein [Alphaproteobacteria bacterium]
MTQLSWFGCVLALGLLSCSGISTTPQERHYCVSSVQDGLANYLISHDNEMASQVVRNELVVLRDYTSQRYQLARHTAEPCLADEQTNSFDEIQTVLRDRVYAATYPPDDSNEWCSFPIGNLEQAERSALFQYLGRLGLKGVGIMASDDQTSVRVADPCPAARGIVRELLSHKGEWSRD